MNTRNVQSFWRTRISKPLIAALFLIVPAGVAMSPAGFAAGAPDTVWNTDRLASRQETTGRQMCDFERRMVAAGLVNVKEIDPTLIVDLKYASANNFMGEAVYGDLKECYLLREAALKLKKAHDLLKKHDPGLRLVLGDGCRPRSIQRRMYSIVKGTPQQRYVANPYATSMHNYGAAVDITIADENGTRLDMGVPMDYFGPLAHCDEDRFLKEGKITPAQVANRRLLRKVMTGAGFQVLSIEWWHFNAFDRKTVMSRYKVIE